MLYLIYNEKDELIDVIEFTDAEKAKYLLANPKHALSPAESIKDPLLMKDFCDSKDFESIEDMDLEDE